MKPQTFQSGLDDKLFLPKRFVFTEGPANVPNVTTEQVEQQTPQEGQQQETLDAAVTRVTNSLNELKNRISSAYEGLKNTTLISNDQVDRMKNAAIATLIGEINALLRSGNKITNTELSNLAETVNTRVTEITLIAPLPQLELSDTEGAEEHQSPAEGTNAPPGLPEIERPRFTLEQVQQGINAMNKLFTIVTPTNRQWLSARENQALIDQEQLNREFSTPLANILANNDLNESQKMEQITSLATRLNDQINAARAALAPQARQNERPAPDLNALRTSEGLAAIEGSDALIGKKNEALTAVVGKVGELFPRGFKSSNAPQDLKTAFESNITKLRAAATEAEVTAYKNEIFGILIEANTVLADAHNRADAGNDLNKPLPFGQRLEAISDILSGEGDLMVKIQKILNLLFTGKMYSQADIAKMEGENKANIEKSVGNIRREYGELRTKCNISNNDLPTNLRHVFLTVGTEIGVNNPLENFVTLDRLDSIAALKDGYTASAMLARAENFVRIMDAIQAKIPNQLTWNATRKELLTTSETGQLDTAANVAQYRTNEYKERGNKYTDAAAADIDEFIRSSDPSVLLEKGDELILVVKESTSPLVLMPMDISAYQDYFGIELTHAEGKTNLTLHATPLGERGNLRVEVSIKDGKVGVQENVNTFTELGEYLAKLQDRVIGTALEQDRVVVGGTEIKYRMPGSNDVTTIPIPNEWHGRLTESGGKIDIPDNLTGLNSFIEIAGAPPEMVLRKDGKEGYHILKPAEGKNVLQVAKEFMDGESRAFNQLKPLVETNGRTLSFSGYSTDGRVSLTVDGLRLDAWPGMDAGGQFIDLSLTADNSGIQSINLFSKYPGGGNIRQFIVANNVPLAQYPQLFNVLTNKEATVWNTFFQNGQNYRFINSSGTAKTVRFNNGFSENNTTYAISLENGRPAITVGTVKYYLNQDVSNFDFHDITATNAPNMNLIGCWQTINSVGCMYNYPNIESNQPDAYYNLVPGQNGTVYVYKQTGYDQRVRAQSNPIRSITMNNDGVANLSDTINTTRAFADVMIARLSHNTVTSHVNSWRTIDNTVQSFVGDQGNIVGNHRAHECRYQLVDGSLYAMHMSAGGQNEIYKYNGNAFDRIDNLSTLPVDLMNIGQKFTFLRSGNREAAGDQPAVKQLRVETNGNFASGWQRVMIGGEDYVCGRVGEQNIVWKGNRAWSLTFANNAYTATEITGAPLQNLTKPEAHMITDAGASVPGRQTVVEIPEPL